MGALQGLAVAARVAARGTQVDHLRQRGLHGDAAAADAAHGCVAAGQSDRDGGRSRRCRTRTREITSEWFGQMDVYSRLRDVYDVANRNNTAVYSLDPRGLALFEFGIDDISSDRHRALPPIAARCR